MLPPNTVPQPSPATPTPTQSNSVSQPLAAPAQGTLPTSDHILSAVAKKIGSVAQGAVSAVQDGVGNVVDAAVGNKPTIVNNDPSQNPVMQAGQSFADKFKNIPNSVMAIEPAIGRASKAFGVPVDALYYTLVSENAPADPNPKGLDPNDQGMFQVNKMNAPMVESQLKKEFGINYDPSNPQHSAMAAAVVLSDTAHKLSENGFKNVSPQDLSIAYRMGATDYSLATRGTDLNGNKGKPTQVVAAKQEYDARLQDLTQNSNQLSTQVQQVATAS